MRWISLFVVVGLIGLGWASLWSQSVRRRAADALISEYLRKFRGFGQTYHDGEAGALQEWLNRHVVQVQHALNEEVARSRYRELFDHEVGPRSRLLIEVLEQMGHFAVPEERVGACLNHLQRCLGVSEESKRALGRALRNPIVLFREGVRVILVSPAILSRWAAGRSSGEVLGAVDATGLQRRVTAVSVTAFLILVTVFTLGGERIVAASAGVAAYFSDAVKEIKALLRNSANQ